MTATTQRTRLQALMKKNSLMSSTDIFHLAVSRQFPIRSSGGMRTKLTILVCRVWPWIFLLSQVSFLFFLFLNTLILINYNFSFIGRS